jgi:hypothetical protein
MPNHKNKSKKVNKFISIDETKPPPENIASQNQVTNCTRMLRPVTSCFFQQNIGNDGKSQKKKKKQTNKHKSFMITLGNGPKKKKVSRLQIFYQWNQQQE